MSIVLIIVGDVKMILIRSLRFERFGRGIVVIYIIVGDIWRV